MPLLEVNDLNVRFATQEGEVHAVNGVSFALERGEALGIVGESGSGKSQLSFSILGLLAANGKASGSVKFDGREILNLPEPELNKLRSDRISMVFQDPMTALNPYMRISDQMAEVLMLHKGLGKRAAVAEAAHMLELVKIPDAKNRVRLFPHEFSGGMRQRVMIAMALLCKPDVLIADEPTTALDVTVQAQIMDLLGELRRELGMATVLITHDLGVVAGFCERAIVMYGGQVMEQSPVDPLFANPTHPYTKGLLAALPRLDAEVAMTPIRGNPPNMTGAPKGCPFCPRCDFVEEVCADVMPPLTEFAPGRARACHRSIETIEEAAA
ncbi:ABC transporter ATP-binding protein [Thioclava sp. JM3]|uniref:oligopeptide/dipeptide ABC transporter ATP-binding protein n=1 Tax=unclassified Thioclava TaxID=2621713 RepID=UPI000B53DA1E|nr:MULTISPECIES: oligopeptide/dipeptide ABC transporter ATP-binding protein [unclassified Thioclava]OWY05835.1 ABC transporter ATP-binding protein [Thioclava sp. F1Mire-8]OWY13798.1 ABC transporter ATP-binding protein [Thioclava sp. F34-6]OWY17863.1 ABC transporter ATP-binding protein [Thioclava sp. JM3]